jgi:hypothetical protein
MDRKAYKFSNVKNFFFRPVFQSFQKARIGFYELLEYTMFSSLSAKYVNQRAKKRYGFLLSGELF